MTGDPAARFGNRAADYVRYRPGYPAEVVDVVARETGLTPEWTIADVGSGTGLSALPFVDHGNVVIGVEPNPAMRAAAERLLAERTKFRSAAGRAEATGLPDHSVDMVLAGQAFHWFDRATTRVEFRRILRPGGWVALLWNTRRTTAAPFMREYEALLAEFGTDYEAVRHDQLDDHTIAAFFQGPFTRSVLANEQILDFEAARGRLDSTSYVPAPGSEPHAAMIERLRDIVDRHAEDGVVHMVYDLEVYCGRLG